MYINKYIFVFVIPIFCKINFFYYISIKNLKQTLNFKNNNNHHVVVLFQFEFLNSSFYV